MSYKLRDILFLRSSVAVYSIDSSFLYDSKTFARLKSERTSLMATFQLSNSTRKMCWLHPVAWGILAIKCKSLAGIFCFILHKLNRKDVVHSLVDHLQVVSYVHHEVVVLHSTPFHPCPLEWWCFVLICIILLAWL